MLTPPSKPTLQRTSHSAEGDEAKTGTPSWCWSRLLGYACLLWIWPPVFRHCVGGGSLATFRFAVRGALRMIAAITQAEVIRKILRPLKRTADPPPLAPARSRPATFDGVA